MGPSVRPGGGVRREARTSPAIAIPFVGGLFLAFAIGLTLGVTGAPPAGLLREAIAGAKDIWWYSRDAWTSTPSQHLEPRLHPGDGVTLALPGEMQPGVTLLSGLFGQTLGFRLYAADGTLLKEWPIDFFQIAPEEMNHRYHALIHGEHLYPNGDIVANLDGRGLVRFDACGHILWRSTGQSHHSVFVDEAGDLWTPTDGQTTTDRSIAAGPFRFDGIARFDPETGETLEQIDLLQALKDGPGPGLVQANPTQLDDVLHVNDVEVLSSAMAPAFPMFEAGDILVSSRNLQQLWILDGQDHRVKWWFAGPLRGQHDPDFQPDGTISVFDNQQGGIPTAANGFLGALGGSRILSIDPETGDWRILYGSDERNSFYSPFRGKHSILPNGNILVAETDAGRAFEVTPEGKPVWEFVNGWEETQVGWVMGAERYPPDYAAVADRTCD